MFKKSVLIGTLAILGLPLVANADLYTDNNTDQYSSAKLTAPSPQPYNCSGMIGTKGITVPGEKNHPTSTTDVKGLCNTVFPCTANVIMETSQADALNCHGTIVSTVTINSSDNVVAISNVPGAAYSVSTIAPNHIVISKN